MITKLNKLISGVCLVLLALIYYHGFIGLGRSLHSAAESVNHYHLVEKTTLYDGKEIGQGIFVIYCDKDSCEYNFGHFVVAEPHQMEVARDLVHILNRARTERTKN